MTSYKILLLEDDESLSKVLQEVLEEEGFEVDACLGSEEAIGLARDLDYDLMVADIRMTGLDGLSALSHVQSYRPSVEGLVITGYADSEQAKRANQLGLGAVLKKPFELDEFLQIVNRLLKERTKRLSTVEAFEHLLTGTRWATSHLAQVLDLDQTCPFDITQGVKVAGYLCAQMELLGSTLERVRLAVLASIWAESQKSLNFPPPVRFPLEFDVWFEGLKEWWDGSGPLGWSGPQIPLPSRVIVLSMAACHRSSNGANLGQKWPGRFDPVLLSCLEQMPEDSPVEDRPPSGSEASHLLMLANTLMHSGDFENAGKALSDVVARGAETREGVRALLLSARLKKLSGLPEEAKSIARRLPELARAFGPLLHAYTLHETGLLLQELGEPGQASTLCLKASEVYTSLGLIPQSIETYLRSRLADHAFPESEEDLERLETLLYPAHREHLRSLAPDLFKALLLKENVGELGRRLAGRLHLAFPKSTQGVLENLPPRNDAVRSTFLSRVTIQDSPEQVDVPADITLKLLGDYRVFVGDSEVPKKAWKTSKSRILFAQLVEAFPSLLTEDSLVEQLWPGSFARAKDSLYVACSQVRSALKKSGLEKPTVVKTSTGIHLNKDLVIEYDVANLVGFLESGRKAYKENRLEEAALHFRQAALLGEDSFFPECYLDWALRLRDELEQKLLFACVAVARIDFAQGNHPQALEFARRALRFDRAHEQAVGILLESLIQVGRKAEATRQYDEFVRVMKEDYDIDDVPSFEELRASIS